MEGVKYTPINEYDVTVESVGSVLPKLDEFAVKVGKLKVFLGFDGYIDSLYSMVSERINAEEWIPMKSMKEFGQRIIDTAGSSCNIERVLKKRLAGGFAPNMARAISHMGAGVFLVGAMGYPNIHPLFKEYPSNVELISVQNMGETAGFEFEDGKVMTTDFGNINNITWELILERVGGRDRFIELIEKSDAIGQGHWSLVPNMNDIWKGMIDEIFPNVKDVGKKLFMVDVADMKKRTPEDILEMLGLLRKIEEFMPAMLSMNDRETIDLSNVLAPRYDSIDSIKKREDYYDFGLKVNGILGLSYVVTHDPHFATITTKDKHYWVTEGYTSTPKFTTAAGDHFNGGAVIGLLCGAEPPEALVIGNALTAIFVRTGISVGFDALKRFIGKYMDFVLNDIGDFPL